MTVSVFVNRAGMDTATSGTGTLTLGSALGAVAPNVCSFLSFAGAGVANLNQVSYLILDSNGGWEVGIGTYTSVGTTLSRTPTNSSNAGAAINLSGTAQVFVTARAQDLARVQGTATNNDAAAGAIGEYLSTTVLVGAAVAGSSGVSVDVATLSLTAGDWDVSGNICTTVGGTTVTSGVQAWISTTSATPPTAPNAGAEVFLPASFTTGQPVFMPVGTRRLSLSATTNVFLSAAPGFSVSTLSLYGFIGARRASTQA